MKLEKLLLDIRDLDFTTGPNFSYNLNREFELISSNLTTTDQKRLQSDFDHFFEKGRFVILNTFAGGILFLKVPERIEKIIIKSNFETKELVASVVYGSKQRRVENIKHKSKAGNIESAIWKTVSIFPHFHQYLELTQKALLLVIGKLVKRICEYGHNNFAYLQIENEFEIELLIDNQLVSKLMVEIK